MPVFHSKRSPSSAHRWRPCPGSVRMEEGLPDDVGEEARQGTAFHEVAADCLELGVSPHHYVGELVYWEEEHEGQVVELARVVTPEMATKMESGLAILRAIGDGEGCHAFTEKRVSLENWIGKDESGTADHFIIDIPNWRIINWDWKWGAGVPVSPEWNDQTMLYTLGVWDDYAKDLFYDAHLTGLGPEGEDADLYSMPEIEVLIFIEQPRAPGGGGLWRTDMSTLLAEGRKIKRDAEATEQPDAPLVPGKKQCQFCKAARYNTCPARAQMVADLIGAEFDDLETHHETHTPLEIYQARALTPEQRAALLKNADLIKGLLSQLHDETMDDSRKGRPTPGYKRVAGRRGARSWENSEAAELALLARLGPKAVKSDIRSPAQIETVMGKQDFEKAFGPLVKHGEPSETLVADTDPRPALSSVEDMFDDDDIL